VEVKAGKMGALKSLQVFVSLKKPELAIRFNTDVPSIIKTKTSVPKMESSHYSLISLPLYMVDELEEIINKLL